MRLRGGVHAHQGARTPDLFRTCKGAPIFQPSSNGHGLVEAAGSNSNEIAFKESIVGTQEQGRRADLDN